MRVISGVASVGEIPVPPVVSTTSGDTARAVASASDTASPSGTTVASSTSYPHSRSAATISGPVRSG